MHKASLIANINMVKPAGFANIYIFFLSYYTNNRRKLITVNGPFMGRQVTIMSNHIKIIYINLPSKKQKE